MLSSHRPIADIARREFQTIKQSIDAQADQATQDGALDKGFLEWLNGLKLAFEWQQKARESIDASSNSLVEDLRGRDAAVDAQAIEISALWKQIQATLSKTRPLLNGLVADSQSSAELSHIAKQLLFQEGEIKGQSAKTALDHSTLESSVKNAIQSFETANVMATKSVLGVNLRGDAEFAQHVEAAKTASKKKVSLLHFDTVTRTLTTCRAP
jgi:ABC-type transporter Mla subunit MlaD